MRTGIKNIITWINNWFLEVQKKLCLTVRIQKMKKEQTITIPLTKIIYVMTTIYMLLITVIVPLYHRDGFCFIGDRKYRLFFISSIFLIPVILLLLFVKHLALKEKTVLSVTDICAIGYACVVTASCMMSTYREIAIWGYEDWHMGTITQLLFVGIYFAVSRGWKWHTGIVKAVCAVSGAIFLLGVMNRFAIDPLQMFEGLEYWNKTHLLATIGNINWYSAYACVIFPLGIYFFWSQPVKEGRWNRQLLKVVYCSIAFATLMTQGSESGLFTLFVVFTAFSYFSLESKDKRYRFLLMNVILGVTACMLGIIYRLCDKEQIYFAADLAIDKIILQPVWWVYTGVVMVLLMGYYLKNHRVKPACKSGETEAVISDADRILQSGKYQRIWVYCVTGMLILIGITVFLHNRNQQIFPVYNKISVLNMNKDWGSGRGLLWSVVWKAYIEMPWIKKIFGAGADCFAPYLYTQYAQLLDGFLAEWWGNAVVANAHNEWLNVLINSGMSGMLTYAGIFMTAIYRWVRNRGRAEVLIGLSICLVGYMVHNTVSFQQVVVTPIVFVILGMGEGLLRENAILNARN